MTSTTAGTLTRSTARRRTALAALPAAVLMLVAACSTGGASADPTTTAPVPPSVSMPPSTQSVERAQAVKIAKANYREWVAMDPDKRADLPPEAREVATQSAIDHVNETNRKIFTKGVTAKGGIRIGSMKVTSYKRPPQGSLVMQTCVVGTLRFYRDGKDITVDESGKPVPKGKETRGLAVVTFTPGSDGMNWRVDAEQTKEESC